MALLDRAIVRLLPAVPKPVVRKLSARYIAGPDLPDACHAVRCLNTAGKLATIDFLGEEIAHEDEAAAIVCSYRGVLAAIAGQGLDSSISVKLTALGLKLDYDVCRANVETVVRDAAERSNFVRIDMEDSSCTEDTLRLYRELRAAGYANVGVVLQSYLRRTLDDARVLAELGANVRLCKGIYVEPEEIAFQDGEEVRASFVSALDTLLAAGSHVGIATHDELLLRKSLHLVARHGRGRDDYEFQMLLGVREDRADELVREGHRLRVYVPFGQHWYRYSLRRLQENPKVAGYIAMDLVKRLWPLRNGRG